MARALGRLLMVPLGFILGAVAALALLMTLGLERATHAVHGGAVDLTQWSQILDLARGFYGLASAATVIPALLLVIIGEVARIRSSIYYVLGGQGWMQLDGRKIELHEGVVVYVPRGIKHKAWGQLKVLVVCIPRGVLHDVHEIE